MSSGGILDERVCVGLAARCRIPVHCFAYCPAPSVSIGCPPSRTGPSRAAARRHRRGHVDCVRSAEAGRPGTGRTGAERVRCLGQGSASDHRNERLLDALDERQLTGVVAHETAHLTNRDARIIWVALFGIGLVLFVATTATAIGSAAAMSGHDQQRRDDEEGTSNNAAPIALVALVVAALMWIVVVPAALIVRATISRRREQLADASAVQFTRDPTGLRQALEIIGRSSVPTRSASMANAALWIRHPGSNNALPAVFGSGRLLDTHPPIAERVAWLRKLEGANTTWTDID